MTAARFGRLFQCDPMALLDRDPSDWPILVAIYEAAALDVAAESKS